MREYRGHLELAERLRSPGRRALVLMHGLPGSGKTAVAQRLLESFGAIRLRSDVERKRLHGVEAQARTDSGLDSGIYAPPATRRTYARLADLARELLAARTTVIVDAAFLRREQRDAFHALARGCAAPLAVVWCRAPEAVMRERLARREGEGKDASEAGVAVLERQLQTQEALDKDELAHTVSIASEQDAERTCREAAAALSRLLGLGARRPGPGPSG
ncbi:MAG: ATP-binding protein [Betaproteobacteria bacterium]|nr:ATP-binding protein [Betaproteobacteria bacterium]